MDVVENVVPSRKVNLIAKWRQTKIELFGLESSLSIKDLKSILESETNVPPERQRIVGLKTVHNAQPTNSTLLAELNLRLPVQRFILMGTPFNQLLVEPSERPVLFDDLLTDGPQKYSAWEWNKLRSGELAVGVHDSNMLGRWKLVWSDLFDYNGVPDIARWEHQVDCNAWTTGPGFDERQWYTSAGETNAWVGDGRLVIKVREHELPQHGCRYTSARLTTRQKGDWKYGRFEVCAKLTPPKRGLWPAIWMMPTTSQCGKWPNSGEIDIMENVGYEPGVVRASIHTANNHRRRGNHLRRLCGVRDAHDTYHVYALEWDEDTINIFVDDRRYLRYENKRSGPDQWPFDQPFHLILNVAVGGKIHSTHRITFLRGIAPRRRVG